ncbi:MAG: hypothetical protein R2716_12010 [Microthrixaceae bacterium]
MAENPTTEPTGDTGSPSWSPPTKNIMAVALALAALVVLYLSRNVLTRSQRWQSCPRSSWHR